MKGLEAVKELAQRGRLYPSSIIYGATQEERQQAAVDLGRILLCERQQGCADGAADTCNHCRRVVWPEKNAEHFHPDFQVLERDLRTSTSVDATKGFLKKAYRAPFEAGGQVFVVAEAGTLNAGAADALLKVLEEPPARTPRHFLLLAASRLDLLVTLRSRSLDVYLGAPDSVDESLVEEIAEAVGPMFDEYLSAPSAIYLLTAADALSRGKGWEDPRARKPWATAAAAVLRYAESRELDPAARRRILELAEGLIDAPRMRMRYIQPARILEGLLCRHLA